jgi:hypothetical protein
MQVSGPNGADGWRHLEKVWRAITEPERPRVFAFEVPAQEGTPGGREGFNGVRFELRPQGDGCLLVFTHVFDDRPAAGGSGSSAS